MSPYRRMSPYRHLGPDTSPAVAHTSVTRSGSSRGVFTRSQR